MEKCRTLAADIEKLAVEASSYVTWQNEYCHDGGIVHDAEFLNYFENLGSILVVIKELAASMGASSAATDADVKELAASMGASSADTDADVKKLAASMGASSAATDADVKVESAFKWAAGEEDRISLLPIQHDDIWEFCKLMEALHWTAQEVDLTRDKRDWSLMTANQKLFVKMNLAFFATIDMDVLKNLGKNFGEEVDCIEAQLAIVVQKDQERVHVESYGLQIASVMEGKEFETILNAARTMPVITRMRDWVLRWFDRRFDIGDRLVAFAAVEGVLFSASFAALQWLRGLNLLPGITNFNSFIVRDEGVHTLFTCLLVRKYLRVKPSQESAEAIFGSVVEVLDEFVTEALPLELIGMNAMLMKEYVRFQADCVLIAMDYTPMWRVKNPFDFMDKLSANGGVKTNFFENRPTQYSGVIRVDQSTLGIDESPIVE